MPNQGFLRVAACVPILRVADCAFNAEATMALLGKAQSQGVELAVFPEMGLAGYTCGDLFHLATLQQSASHALMKLARDSQSAYRGAFFVGLPWVIDDQLFNCAAFVHHGKVLGIVPKSYLPNYKEFYDDRYFAAGVTARSDEVMLPGGERIPFGTDLLFEDALANVVVGIEICEDLWTPIPPSSRQALAGANVLLNLSASNELIGKAGYRRQLVSQQSGRCIAGYVYASCGVHESTTDLVFGGHSLIAENGGLLAESDRFSRESHLIVTDIDLDRLRTDRLRTMTFSEGSLYGQQRPFRRIGLALDAVPESRKLSRAIDPHPFVPSGETALKERCEEIFHTQTAGLAKRLERIGTPPVTIGVSGGLDSTLALLVACRTFDLLGKPRTGIQAFTMPGYGTTTRTKKNAHTLMRELGVSAREIDIRALCLAEWQALGHKPFGIDLTGLTVDALAEKLKHLPPERRNDLVFENVQARARTNLLMNAGFVIGTGDLSELALGWCTYNADHMSMYNVNVSVPKTLVKFLVRWAADSQFEGESRATLRDIVASEISPELLPADASGATQSTEGTIGPYELHDFFLYHLIRGGASLGKVLYLAEQARFDGRYSPDQIRNWLRVFIQRFFANQFKRSCLPDGPKVGSVSLSPRGDWRMPSDAVATAWLAELDRRNS